MSKERNIEMLDAVGEAAAGVAAFTGIKQQFMDSGWSEASAERMVYAMLMTQGSGGAR